MGWSDEDDEDEQPAKANKKPAAEGPRQERLIDERFARLMEAEYDEDEIGY